MQKVEVLHDVLIQAGDVDKYYGDSVPVNLWRAKNLNKSGLGLFTMVEEEERRGGNGSITRFQQGPSCHPVWQ